MKRFTETNKWADGWFSELEPLHKLAWMYLLDNCDGAGVIDRPARRATFETGVDNWDAFLAAAEGKIEVLDCGKWFIVNFIEHQYKGSVSKTSNHHSLVRHSLRKYKLNDRYGIPIGGASNNHREPSEGGSQVKDKVKDKVKDEVKDEVKDKETDQETDNWKATDDATGVFGDRFAHCAKVLSEIHPKWTPAGIGNRYRQQAHEDEGAFLTVTDDELADIVRFYQRPPKGETLCKSLGAILASLPTQRDRAATWAQHQPSVNGSAVDDGEDPF